MALALVVLCPCDALASTGTRHVHAVKRERRVAGLTPTSLTAGPLGPVEDPLAANGFTSPSCTTPSLFTQLSAAAQTNCEVSGVAVAAVPLSNYAFDTNVESGLGASFSDDVDSIVQDLLITPVWTAIVWLVHVAVVALEWCYTIDLLAPSMLNSVVNALNDTERIFTQPWLGLALALAGIAFAWNGLVRRRVAETLGQALLMSAMIALGLWIIADPVGTIGAVSQLSDEAALGTLAAITTGDASQPEGSLDNALGEVFDSAITGPWCYLEFGDVDWCREQSELDPQLERTGHALEQLYRAGATCHGPTPGLVECVPGGSAEQRTYATTAMALSAARTNGALFLALPANGLARNDLASQTSLPTLYGTLCGSSDPTDCAGGTVPQAEFRTAEGTWPRAGGVLLIALGAAGMLAMLGFVALRLLGAALAVLVYLLLAPLAVLAPAFGDSGRATFRHWLTRLVGAALAKLVYSVMLGVTLLVVDLLTSVSAFGWWTQWLLISVFWWLAFEHRHRMLAFVVHERGEQTSRLPLATRVRYGSQVLGSVRRASRFVGHGAATSLSGTADVLQQARGFRSEPGASSSPPSRVQHEARAKLAAQVEHSLVPVRAARFESLTATPALRDQLAALRIRRERLTREEHVARGEGSGRRAVSLARRGRVVDEQIARHGADLAIGRRGRLLPRLVERREQRRWSQQLDRAARSRGGERGQPREYALLAGLAGLSPSGYGGSSAAARMQARLEIDRQLAERRRWLDDARSSVRLGLRRPAARDAGGDAVKTVLDRRARQFGSRVR